MCFEHQSPSRIECVSFKIAPTPPARILRQNLKPGIFCVSGTLPPPSAHQKPVLTADTRQDTKREIFRIKDTDEEDRFLLLVEFAQVDVLQTGSLGFVLFI